jgi:trigger factor
MRMSKEDYLTSIEKTEEEFDADLVEQSQRSVKVSFVLDELARTENLSVNQSELSYFVADQAQRMGVSPDYFAQQLVQNNQINVAVTEVLRGKAATIAAERIAVTDEAGNAIDVKAQIEELNTDVDAMLAAQAAEEAAAEPVGDIEVSDLSIDVAGTIESDEAEVVGEIVEEIAAEAEVVKEAEEIKDSEA